MFELLGWFAFLITAMAMLYGYLKVEHSLLHENRLITVSGDGLAPHLEKAMLDVFGEIQRRAAEEKPPLLTPGQPDRFRFEVTVAASPEEEGYIAASPQFKGLLAWGPSIEYAVLEFGFALHLHAETVVDNDETFERQNPLLPGSGRD